MEDATSAEPNFTSISVPVHRLPSGRVGSKQQASLEITLATKQRASVARMITMTSREAASLFFTDVDRAISPEAPDVPKFLEIAKRHQLTVPGPPG